MDSPLQLEGFHIKRLSVVENPAYVEQTDFKGDLTIEPEVMVHRSEANRYVLALRIGWHPKSGAEARLPYDVDVEGEAFYRLDKPCDLTTMCHYGAVGSSCSGVAPPRTA